MIVGIDLGTTNSAAAVWRDGEAVLVPKALGALLTPSAVSIDASGQSWVGTPALDRMATRPAQAVTSFMRLMGTEQAVSLGKRDWRAVPGALRDAPLADVRELQRLRLAWLRAAQSQHGKAMCERVLAGRLRGASFTVSPE